MLQIDNEDMNELEIETSSALFCFNLVHWFFENVTDFPTNLRSRITLSLQNEGVNRINEMILDKISGNKLICYSIDKATINRVDRDNTLKEDAAHIYRNEYLHLLTPSGMPPHMSKLKKDA